MDSGFIARALLNWRTTAMGIGSIMAGAGDLIAQVGDGHIRSDQIGPDITGILLGLGFLFARDSKVSEDQHHDDRTVALRAEERATRVEEKVDENASKLQELH